MTWYNTRYDFFYNSIQKENDWFNDGLVSVSGEETVSTGFSLESNYLSKAVNEAKTELDKVLPSGLRKYSAGMGLEMFHYVDEFNITAFKLLAFDSNFTTTLSHSLTQGRMPQNYTEVVFYKTNASHSLPLNTVIPLQVTNLNTSKTMNCTVVGILENMNNKFYQEGCSVDILTWKGDSYFSISGESKLLFYTTEVFFNDVINYYAPNFDTTFELKIDFDYQFTIQHIRSISNILKQLSQYYYSSSFHYIPGYFVNFALDLNYALSNFNMLWLQQTVGIFASALPVVFLFGLLSMETFNIGTHEQESKFRLMKTHGLELKEIRRVLLLENFVKTLSGLAFGFGLGALLGYGVFLGIGSQYKFNYFASALEPLLLSMLGLLFITSFLGGFLIEYSLAKKAAVTAPTQYKKKRKFFRKIFSIKEVAILLPAVLFLTAGLLGMFFIDWFLYEESAIINTIRALCWFSVIIGIFFALTSVFLLIARLVNLFWGALGKKSWKSTKSYFTLSLKHLSIYGKNYQRIILATLIFGLGITPGLVMKKSINSHVPIEADLSVGCADLLVEGWENTNPNLQSNISKISGVELLTEVSVITLETSNYWYVDSPTDMEATYRIWLLAIKNLTTFVDVIDFSILEQEQITKEDIKSLQTNFTYLMEQHYAHKQHYDKGIPFKTTMITSRNYEPYEMTFIKGYDYFPLLPRVTGRFINKLFKIYEFNLVTNHHTAQLLINRTDMSKTVKSYLLLKTTANANTTKIKEELVNNFNLKAQTPKDKEKSIHDNVNRFAIRFLMISSIATLITTFLFGIFSAINLYQQRLRVIESEYQIGATRRQIWGNFTIELLWIILIPVGFTMLIAFPIIRYLSVYVIDLNDIFKEFIPWLPWWLVLILVFLGITTMTLGWLVKMIPLVRGYRPIKQE